MQLIFHMACEIVVSDVSDAFFYVTDDHCADPSLTAIASTPKFIAIKDPEPGHSLVKTTSCLKFSSLKREKKKAFNVDLYSIRLSLRTDRSVNDKYIYIYIYMIALN